MHHLLAWLLLAITLATHTAYLLFDARDAERVFYVARGIEGVSLFVCLAYFTFRPTLRRVPTGVLFIACVIGAYSELMTAICGVPVALDPSLLRFPILAPVHGVCGVVTGLPWGWVDLLLLVVAALYFTAVARGRGYGRDSGYDR